MRRRHPTPYLDHLKKELIKIMIAVQSVLNIFVIVFALRYDLHTYAIIGQGSMLLVMFLLGVCLYKGIEVNLLSIFVTLYYTFIIVPLIRFFLGPLHILPIIMAIYTAVLIVLLLESKCQLILMGLYILVVNIISLIDIRALSNTSSYSQVISRSFSIYTSAMLIVFSVYIFKKKFIFVSNDLYKNSLKDTLTGAYNVRMLRDILNKLQLKFERENAIFSIAMVDLDDFKGVNDHYGHDVGDAILCDFVACVKSQLRPMDDIIRYGGDEFVVVFQDCTCHRAAEITERITQEAKKINKKFSKDIFSFSAGVCDSKEAKDNHYPILKLADMRMYLAKEKGKNKIVSQSQ